MRGRGLQEMFKRWKILRGDRVRIMTGKDKGQQGTVIRVFREKNRVLVEGQNLVVKHMKPQEGRPGQKVLIEMPVHVSNVRLLHPVTGEPCAVTWKATREPIPGAVDAERNQKFRTVRERIVASGDRTGEDILVPRPAGLADRKKPKPTTAGLKDTPREAVRERTFDPSSGIGGLPPLEELLDKLNIRPHLREGTAQYLVREEQRRGQERERRRVSR
ncbi:chloroplast ribosomal protein L24 precursor [Klebsormidium nitens]|uniref:Chloroplast ribosomal protein L24 n=1 Tax=Klebsormidium nitens TaxID=105231 RepID=A0A1Y1I559_KLENI|nr:chloroplast ribosomal protein L24 precursor [Klebsormidium nitens]|eukprot:GAQ83857.1 chloroplast ribosomal protein L24 precursor [Klebsormidium nitens]